MYRRNESSNLRRAQDHGDDLIEELKPPVAARPIIVCFPKLPHQVQLTVGIPVPFINYAPSDVW